MSAVLLVVDAQEAVNDARGTRGGGERGQPDAETAIGRLVAHWRERGERIVHLRHDSMDPDAPDAVGASGHAFLPAARPAEGETVVEHRTTNTFIGTDLMQVLEDAGSHELVVCGATLEGAVESTVRMAHALGFLCLVPRDAVIARAARNRDGRHWPADEVAALTLAVMDGAFASVVDTAALVSGAEAGATVQ